jgi:hypothetical protein
MAFELIRSAADWRSYLQQYAAEHGIATVNGRAPQQYPCLVDSIPNGEALASCYVYPQQAEALLEAAQAQPSPAAAPADLETTVARLVHNILSQSIRGIAANLRTIVEELVEVKVTSHERYEKLLAKHLADIDQYVAEQAANRRMANLEVTPWRVSQDDGCNGV